MAVYLSGIQPTGSSGIHLGNYIGAIRNWKEVLSESTEKDTFYFFIPDLHAMTVTSNAATLQESVLDTFAFYLACGLDPSQDSRIKIFQQSMIPQHTQLMWLLSCYTQVGWLDRMTQYKDKTKASKARECLGLYSYPVLMASDILLYNVSHVPVGEDQVQHVELTRDIASKINRLHKGLLTLPKYILPDCGKRIMSLRDGTSKMSKSDPSDSSRINITDSDDDIVRKIKKAQTGNPCSPEVVNLRQIYVSLAREEPDLESFSQFKKDLADVIISAISVVRKSFVQIAEHRIYLKSHIEKYSLECEEVARKNFKRIQDTLMNQ